MSYWKYRAYDASMTISEGILISHHNGQNAPEQVILALRQQGLCGFHLEEINHAEYKKELYIQKLKNRANKLAGG